MAVNSKNLVLGTKAYNFHLVNIDGKKVSLNESMAKNGLVVAFICNHCPYVVAIQERLIELYFDLKKLDVNMVAINSNDSVNYPEDSFENMQKLSREKNYPFVYLFDESQEVAKKFDVACTPEFYGINNQGQILYHGRIDDSGKNSTPNSRRELYLAMSEIVKTGKAPSEQIPSIGCSIKWREI